MHLAPGAMAEPEGAEFVYELVMSPEGMELAYDGLVLEVAG